ncbi:MAG: YifB family Mg chelatase-like AAA ATPase [Peptococcaceae bacterium]|nr:YifB family Mg chelatase-like AAA ATPase [Peptococcaceae bacterium]
MFAAVYGMSVEGLTAHLVRVEVDISNGLPGFEVVGLAATAVREAKDRVRSALKNSGFQFPLQRITVNLAPADLRKEGSGLDLPIAVGILAALGEVDPAKIRNHLFIGELSLEGTLRPVPGILTMAVGITNLKKSPTSLQDSFTEFSLTENNIMVVPPANLAEARLVPDIQSESVENLQQLIQVLNNKTGFTVEPLISSEPDQEEPPVDWSDIRGQAQAKRALEIAATGGHNLLMIGPPGSGKTLLARAFAGILPPLTSEESLEVTQLYSSAGLFSAKGTLITRRPFRSPHHNATVAAVIGGGQKLRPGELVLANHGVLFLDELPEFSREVLESLRQPLEDRKFTLIRQRGAIEYPARVSVLAGMNPCPCGFYGDNGKQCTCTPWQVHNYRNRVSGPLLDRFDLQIEVPRLSYSELKEARDYESSSIVRERVIRNRQKQWQRFGNSRTNAEMTSRETKEICVLDSSSEALLKKVFDQNFYSARAYDRILRVARTIADMADSEQIKIEHLAESLQYRALDRELKL